MPLRFHLDEHVSPAVAEGLRDRGIDVTTTHEAGLAGVTDPQVITYAIRAGRVIVTNDHNYLQHNAAGVPHAGIAYCRPGKLSIGETIRYLLLMDSCYSLEDMRDRVEYMSA